LRLMKTLEHKEQAFLLNLPLPLTRSYLARSLAPSLCIDHWLHQARSFGGPISRPLIRSVVETPARACQIWR